MRLYKQRALLHNAATIVCRRDALFVALLSPRPTVTLGQYHCGWGSTHVSSDDKFSVLSTWVSTTKATCFRVTDHRS